MDQHRDALLQLHARAGAFGGLDPSLVPGFDRTTDAEALRTVARADERKVSVAARLRLLHGLATADFPGHETAEKEYHALAASVADARGLDTKQLLSDLKESARESVPFADTTTGRALPHPDVAFIGQDVCTTRMVHTDGLVAAWVFSEFETDAPFDGVAGWVDPRSWPERGPMMFKRMDLVGASTPVEIAALGSRHWHGVFHEEVQLVKRVNTLLHCDYWRGDRAAGMTYHLDLSLDGEIDVDRGFLSVEDMGEVRRVRALKIVGFTDDAWDEVAQLVCPFWTDWVRGAVEGGTTSTPTTPEDTPPSGGPGPGDAPPNPAADTFDAWIQFFSESARTYLDLFADIGSKATARGTTPADWLGEGNRYWSQLAKDWATAWTHGLRALEDVAREGIDAGVMPPGTDPSAGRGFASAMTAAATRTAAAPPSPPAGESTTVPVPGLTADTPVECSRLVSIESGGASISEVSVTVEPLGPGRFGARVHTTDLDAPAGLYVGTLQTPGGQVLAPVQLYVARARGAERA